MQTLENKSNVNESLYLKFPLFCRPHLHRKSSVFRVHACFTVCLAHCLSICLGIIFVNTVWAHTQTQAHAHMHTNHSSPAQDSELSLRFKVKEMQQVNWSLRGQQGLISLFYPIRAMKTGIDRCFHCLNVDD